MPSEKVLSKYNGLTDLNVHCVVRHRAMAIFYEINKICDKTISIVYFKIVKNRLFAAVRCNTLEFFLWVPESITHIFLPGHSRTHMCVLTYDVIITSRCLTSKSYNMLLRAIFYPLCLWITLYLIVDSSSQDLWLHIYAAYVINYDVIMLA